MNPPESEMVLPVAAPDAEDSADKEYKPPVLEAPSTESLTASNTPQKRTGRRKINIEFIEDKSRRHITFSKRKAGIMKKAYELSTLTGTQVLLLVASETGHVYTFATPKLQPLITKPDGKNLIQACLNAPDTLTQAPPGIGAQMSPGYGQAEHALPQADYSQPSPHSPYAQHEEEKPSGFLQRSYGDSKAFQSQNESLAEPPSMPYSPYAGSHHPMMSPGPRMAPYSHSQSNAHGGPSLPTLTDRGSFSNLPNHAPNYPQFPSQSIPSPYNPMNGSGPFPSSSFPSHTFPNPNSGLFKPSNLPPVQRDD